MNHKKSPEVHFSKKPKPHEKAKVSSSKFFSPTFYTAAQKRMTKSRFYLLQVSTKCNAEQTKYNEQNQKIEFSFFIFSLDGMKKHGEKDKKKLNFFVSIILSGSRIRVKPV